MQVMTDNFSGAKLFHTKLQNSPSWWPWAADSLLNKFSASEPALKTNLQLVKVLMAIAISLPKFRVSAGAFVAMQRLADGLWVNSLWQSARVAGGKGVAAFTSFYSSVLKILKQPPATSLPKERDDAILSVDNALAFGAKGLLPAFWRRVHKALLNCFPNAAMNARRVALLVHILETGHILSGFL